MRRKEFYNMNYDGNDDELKLTKEYKDLLSYIRPLIEQLDKSRDAQLCLLWLSKLEQCTSWEWQYRNKILSELCKQVKANCLKPPFSVAPPNGSLRNVICADWKVSNWNSNESFQEVTTEEEEEEVEEEEEEMYCTSHQSYKSLKSPHKRLTPTLVKKSDYLCSPGKNKNVEKTGKDLINHSECFAIQKAYHERAQSDQIVIERYQNIVKSLVSQQLKADISPGKVKKLQSMYETKMSELMESFKKAQEENDLLRRKIDSATTDFTKLNELRVQNEALKNQVLELEASKAIIEAKYKQAEEEKLMTLTDLIGKLSESDKKLKEAEKRSRSMEKKYNECYRNYETEYQAQVNRREQQYLSEVSSLEKLLEEKQAEVASLKEELRAQRTKFEEEISQLKRETMGISNVEKNIKKIKSLKIKTKKLEKMREHMSLLFQAQLQQILTKKDFYIASLEMQLKMNKSDTGSSNLETDINELFNQKLSTLEEQYRKLLEDSEQQSLKRRQLDLQKIHTLEKQLLQFGEVIEDVEPNLTNLKTNSVSSATVVQKEMESDKIF